MDYLHREARAGDAVLAIGAGNVNRALADLAVLLGHNPAGDKPATPAPDTPAPQVPAKRP